MRGAPQWGSGVAGPDDEGRKVPLSSRTADMWEKIDRANVICYI